MKTCPICDSSFPDQHKTCPTDGAVLISTRRFDPGHIVRGKYRILRMLGEGGMGVVYLAEDTLLGVDVALKFLAGDLGRDSRLIRRFRNEARAAFQLRHPNIVEVHALDQTEDGTLFIAMEFVDGPSLRSLLYDYPAGLPVDLAISMVTGVAAGLAAAHARGIVHRDIKPENILISTTLDNSRMPKILDFGIAAVTEGATRLSHTQGLLLTPEYAAPEQWRGTPAGSLDGRTDLYSLGCVFYEVLTGRAPYHAHNIEGWMMAHLQGAPEPIARLRPEIARNKPHLIPIVMGLLAREAADRVPSALTLLEELANHPLAPEPQRPKTVVEQSPRPDKQQPGSEAPLPRKDRPSVRASSSGRESAPQAPPPVSLDPRPVPLQPGRRKGLWVVLLALAVIAAGVGALMGNDLLHRRGNTAAGDPSMGAKPLPQTISQPVKVPVLASATSKEPSIYDQARVAYDSKDFTLARLLFIQACDQGEYAACNYLGYLYAQGLGGERDAAKAGKVWQIACEKGIAKSCFSLGSLHMDSGEQAAARKWFQKACDGGLQVACSMAQ